MEWILKKFDELSTFELYSILRLRNEVFVVEQNCVYQDLDNRDQLSWHLTCWHENKPVAYTRILPPGILYQEPSIGRVVTEVNYRNKGLGKELMERSIKNCELLFGKQDIKLGAQLYLKEFYISLGFLPEGNIYLEDGIEHIAMIKSIVT